MKKLWILICIPVLLSACSTSKEAVSARKEKKITNELLVKNAVDSRKFIIKLQRLYSLRGSYDLVPSANYIIINGDKAAISTAYLGRQFDIRPIAAINTRGQAENYELTSKPERGKYEVRLKVNNGGPNTFDLYLTIGKNGSVNASVSSMKIENVRYSGYLVPITERSPRSPEGAII